MYCSNCGLRQPAGANFCNRCGYQIRNVKAVAARTMDFAPRRQPAPSESLNFGETPAAAMGLAVPMVSVEMRELSVWRELGKLLALNVLTLGLYYSYWSYQRWTLVGRLEGRPVKAALRGFLAPISNFWLFGRLQRLAGERAGFSLRYHARLRALLFLLLGMVAARGGAEPVTVSAAIYLFFSSLQMLALKRPMAAYVALINEDAAADAIDQDIPVSVGLISMLVVLACVAGGLCLYAYTILPLSN